MSQKRLLIVRRSSVRGKYFCHHHSLYRVMSITNDISICDPRITYSFKSLGIIKWRSIYLIWDSIRHLNFESHHGAFAVSKFHYENS